MEGQCCMNNDNRKKRASPPDGTNAAAKPMQLGDNGEDDVEKAQTEKQQPCGARGAGQQKRQRSKLFGRHGNSSHTNATSGHSSNKPSLSRAHKLLIMLSMTFFFFLIELIFGYISHSMALIADSFHMMSDVLALSIAYGCLKIAERSRSSKNTFGWVRAEVLGALVNGVFLLALCFTILIESIQRILEPEPIKNPLHVLIVGVIGFLINMVGMAMFHGAHVGHAHGSHGVEDMMAGASSSCSSAAVAVDKAGTIEGEEAPFLLNSHQDRAMTMAELEAVEESLMTHTPRQKKAGAKSGGGDHLNMRAVFLHILSDAVGSVIVIATALASWLLPDYEWLKLYMDPSLSIVLVALMVCTTLPLVRETALILLQTTPKFVNVDKLQTELLSIDGIVAVHEFHVWRLVGERIIATVHIRFRTLRHYVLAAEQIRALFHDNHIHSTTIQPEFAEMDTSANPSELECAFACLPNNCKMLENAVVTCCDKEKRAQPKKSTTVNVVTHQLGTGGPTVVNIVEEQQSLDLDDATASSSAGNGGTGDGTKEGGQRQ